MTVLFITLVYVVYDVSTGVSMSQCTCGRQKTPLGSQFSLSILDSGDPAACKYLYPLSRPVEPMNFPMGDSKDQLVRFSCK